MRLIPLITVLVVLGVLFTSCAHNLQVNYIGPIVYELPTIPEATPTKDDNK